MILQSFTLPDECCQNKKLYFQTDVSEGGKVTDESIIITDEKVCLINEHVCLSSDSYMNLLDTRVWKNNTNLETFDVSFKIHGKGVIEIWNRNDEERHLVASKNYNMDETGDLYFENIRFSRGYYYFVIKTEKTTELKESNYQVKNKPLREIYLSVVICTYKRETELIRNVNKLRNSRFFTEGDALFEKMHINVVDNASTLKEENKKGYSLYHNPNTGGSGGFTRGMEETAAMHDKFPATNVILMDDDVMFQIETFYRVYALLSFVKEEFQQEVIAGRMFRLDDRKVQYTAVEIWNGGNLIHIGENQDMENTEDLKSVNAGNGEYSGWWFAVFPYEFVRKNRPMQAFLHCDDVEYGLRHGGAPIIMNGVQVWHETSEYRQNPVIGYYDMRNRMVVNKKYGYLNKNTYEDHLNIWRAITSGCHAEKEYSREYLYILGMKDFLLGKYEDKVKDPEKLHYKLSKITAGKIKTAILWHLVCGFYKLRYK